MGEANSVNSFSIINNIYYNLLNSYNSYIFAASIKKCLKAHHIYMNIIDNNMSKHDFIFIMYFTKKEVVRFDIGGITF